MCWATDALASSLAALVRSFSRLGWGSILKNCFCCFPAKKEVAVSGVVVVVAVVVVVVVVDEDGDGGAEMEMTSTCCETL